VAGQVRHHEKKEVRGGRVQGKTAREGEKFLSKTPGTLGGGGKQRKKMEKN